MGHVHHAAAHAAQALTVGRRGMLLGTAAAVVGGALVGPRERWPMTLTMIAVCRCHNRSRFRAVWHLAFMCGGRVRWPGSAVFQVRSL